jgi:RHS repeat-associated protein
MNGGTVSLLYDGDGNLVAKTVSGVTTRYLVDSLNPTGNAQVVEELVNAAVQRQYTYGRQRISENQIISNAWTSSFYAYDGAGSVRELTNSAGTVTDTYEYDAFGNEVNSTGTTPNNYLYRSERYDSNVGLYYLRARWYNPITGRFLSRDPANGDASDPGSLHKYLYSRANPINRSDPSGLADAEEYSQSTRLLALSSQVTGALANLANKINCVYMIYGDILRLESRASAGNEFWLALDVTACTVFGGEAGGGVEEGGFEGGGAEGGTGDSEGGMRGSCGGPLSGCLPKEQGLCCFAAGTPIHTKRGVIPVERVEVGDEFLSRNRASGTLEYKPVTALTKPHLDRLLEMRIEGEQDPLRPSLDHPFWVKRGEAMDGAWLEAGKMQLGDRVQNIQGNWRRVTALIPIEGQQTVYNFTVGEDHDYFVGSTGTLVHNSNCIWGNVMGKVWEDWLEEQPYMQGVDVDDLWFNTDPGETGPDFEYLGEGPSPLPGGADYAELKPANDAAVAAAKSQILAWQDGRYPGVYALYVYTDDGTIFFWGIIQ